MFQVMTEACEKGDLFNQLQALKKDEAKREPMQSEMSIRKLVYTKV
jgi:hypothetical protein